MKKFIFLVLFVGLWVYCGSKAHDAALGEFTAQFPDQCHEGFATVWGYSGGPIAWAVEHFDGDGNPPMRHGYTKQQRWEAFHEEFSPLSFDYFNAQSGHCLGDPDPDFKPKESQ